MVMRLDGRLAALVMMCALASIGSCSPGGDGAATVGSTSSHDPTSESPSGPWRTLAAAPLEPRGGHVAVWAGSEMIVWGGRSVIETAPGDDRTPTGYSYDPKTGIKTPFVDVTYRDGAAYEPRTDSWRELPPAPVDDVAVDAAVWTGREMLLWVRDRKDRLLGVAYRPETDSWRSIPNHPLVRRFSYPAAWTGTEMIVAAGIDYSGARPPRGLAYDPATEEWRKLAPAPAAPPDWSNAIWAGAEMIVWGGSGASEGSPPWSGGFAYDPIADAWRELPRAPIEERADFQQVWTGRELIVWGGQAGPFGRADGAAYDPRSNSWRVLARSPLAPRYWAPTVWTGRRMVIWGGYNVYAPRGERRVFGDGAAYDPVADRWTVLPGSPISARCDHSGVWTGRELILWGGTRHCGGVGPRDGDGAALTIRP